MRYDLMYIEYLCCVVYILMKYRGSFVMSLLLPNRWMDRLIFVCEVLTTISSSSSTSPPPTA